jgi:hypothetical protein
VAGLAAGCAKGWAPEVCETELPNCARGGDKAAPCKLITYWAGIIGLHGLHRRCPQSRDAWAGTRTLCLCPSKMQKLDTWKSAIFYLPRRIFSANKREFATKPQHYSMKQCFGVIGGAAFTVGALAFYVTSRSAVVFSDEMQSWNQRWKSGQISFHINEVHPCLSKFLGPFLEDGISSPKFSKRVLVPLCGKTVDMIFLQNLGHKVLRLFNLE